MDQRGGFRERFHERIHGRRLSRWRSGELDDAGFERSMRTWARKVVLGVFVVLTLAAVGLDWLEGRRAAAEQLERSLVLAALLAVFGVVAALHLSGHVRFAARDLVLRRNRERVEQDPALALLPDAPRARTALALFGSYSRGTRYPNVIIAFATAIVLLSCSLLRYYGSGRALLLLAAGAVLLVWGLFMRLDPRTYLVLAPDGIWCRAWGPERLAFGEFKAVYPRDRGLLSGVVLVPRSAAELRNRLSWFGRYQLRSGGGTPAHVGTLTLWTTEVDLPRDSVLQALQSEVVRAQPVGH